MAFGADYQKEVNDVNAGKIQPKAIAPINVAATKSSKQTVRLDPRGKYEGMEQLADVAAQAGKHLSVIHKRQQAKDYDQAYAEGSQEKLDEVNNSSWLSKMFGNKATLRGFQQRVIDDEVELDYQNRLGTMDADVRKYSSLKEYKDQVGDPLLQQALETQTDGDVKTGIATGYIKNTRQLAGQFAKKRAMYEQVLNRKAVLNSLASASKTMEAAKTTQDESVLRDANDRMVKAMTRPDDVAPEAWESMVKTSIIAGLGNDDLNLLQVAKHEGVMDDFSPETLGAINEAKSIWNQDYSQDFYNRGIELEQTLKDNPQNFDKELAAYKQRYPNLDTKRWLKEQRKVTTKRQNEARELQANTQIISQGMGKTLSKQKRAAAFTNLTNRLGKEAARQARLDAIRDNPDEAIDINAAYTPEEINTAIKAAPNKLVSAWVNNQVSEVPLLKASVANIVTLSNQEALTETQGNALKEDLQFAQHFIKRGRDLFDKQMPPNQLARVLHMDLLMNKMGYDHRKAVIEIRAGKKRDPLDFDQVDSRSESNEALRDFTDANGFENFLQWSSDPDNQDALEIAAEREFGKLLRLTNDVDVAKQLTVDFLASNSTRFGDNLLLDGKELDKVSKNGDFAGYADLVENTESWKDDWETTGFPRERSIKDDANVITVHNNGRGITIRGTNVDGGTIYKDLLAPTSDYDMRTLLKNQIKTDVTEDMGILEAGGTMMLHSYMATGNILNDIFATPSTPASHLPPEAPAESTAPTERSSVIQSILKKEGGLSMKSTDRGNFNSKGELVGTNFGISAKFLENKLGRVPTAEDVRNITEDQAAKWHQENITTEITAIKKHTKKQVAPKSELLLSHMTTLTSRKGILKVFKNLPSNAPPEQVAEEYLKYLRTLSSWKDNGAGWTARVNDIVKQSQ